MPTDKSMGYFKFPCDVFADEAFNGLGHPQRTVWLYIMCEVYKSWFNFNRNYIISSINKLAIECRTSRQTVREVVKIIIKQKWSIVTSVGKMLKFAIPVEKIDVWQSHETYKRSKFHTKKQQNSQQLNLEPVKSRPGTEQELQATEQELPTCQIQTRYLSNPDQVPVKSRPGTCQIQTRLVADSEIITTVKGSLVVKKKEEEETRACARSTKDANLDCEAQPSSFLEEVKTTTSTGENSNTEDAGNDRVKLVKAWTCRIREILAQKKVCE